MAAIPESEPVVGRRASFFTWKWILTTLLVAAAAAVMVRLGLWQLDRLAQRRAFNDRVKIGLSLPALDLNQAVPESSLPEWDYRPATVRGSYLADQAILLRNQIRDGQPGYDLLVPLAIQGSGHAVLVNLGYISLEEGSPQRYAAYIPVGDVTLQGRIRRSQSEPAVGGRPDTLPAAGQRLEAWNFLYIDGIAAQVDRPLLPVWFAAAPQPGLSGPPYRSDVLPELDEGPHFSYAMQWFLFTVILLVGYPFYVRKQLSHS